MIDIPWGKGDLLGHLMWTVSPSFRVGRPVDLTVARIEAACDVCGRDLSVTVTVPAEGRFYVAPCPHEHPGEGSPRSSVRVRVSDNRS